MTDIDNVNTIVQTAKQAAAPSPVEPGSIYVVTTADGPETIDLTGDEYRDAPRRKTGTVSVYDAPSFLAYWNKHSDGDSELFAFQQQRTITAVLDAHTAAAPRWETHRLVLRLRHTPEWEAWNRIDGKFFDQAAFAEFLEDRAPDIQEPNAATMLEIAQSIQGTVKADFEAGARLDNGARRLRYTETTTASAGAKGELAIPPALTLRLLVFEGAAVADSVAVRLRYRINGGSLQLGIKLLQPEDVVAGAFESVVDDIVEGVAPPVLRGSPA